MTMNELKSAIDLINSGETLNRQDRLPEALEHQDKAIQILFRLVNQDGTADLAHQLVLALCNRGLVARRLNRLLDALTSYDQASRFMESRLGEKLTEIEAADAATAFSGRGVVLEMLGWKDGALVGHKMAVDLYRQLAQDTKIPEYVDELARALMNKTAAHFALKQYAEVLVCDQEVLDIRQKQVDQFGIKEFGGSLARALWGKAVALEHLGRSDEALAVYDSATALSRELIQLQQSTNDLAGILLDKAKTLQHQRQYEAASDCCTESVALYESQINDGKGQHLADLLETLRLRFDLSRLRDDWPQAARDALLLLTYFDPVLKGKCFKEDVTAEIDRFAKQLSELSGEQQKQLYDNLGERTQDVRNLLSRAS